eukprot:Colp12_sorted_trinity150504_noHs@13490
MSLSPLHGFYMPGSPNSMLSQSAVGLGKPVMKEKRKRNDSVSDEDKIQRKKARNREAAQQIRDRNKLRVSKLEENLTELEKENKELTSRESELSSENRLLLEKLALLKDLLAKQQLLGSSDSESETCSSASALSPMSNSSSELVESDCESQPAEVELEDLLPTLTEVEEPITESAALGLTLQWWALLLSILMWACNLVKVFQKKTLTRFWMASSQASKARKLRTLSFPMSYYCGTSKGTVWSAYRTLLLT